MIHPEGILPAELLTASKRAEVIAWLVAQPLPGYFKRGVLQGWGKLVGVKLTQEEYAQVDLSGER